MLSDAHPAVVAVVTVRLAELIAELDDHFGRIRKLLQEIGSVAEDSDTLNRRIGQAVLWANFLREDFVLAKEYFEKVHLGPDAELLLKQIEELPSGILAYGKLVASLFSGDFQLPDSDSPNDGGNLFLPRWWVIEESYHNLRRMVETICNDVGKTPTGADSRGSMTGESSGQVRRSAMNAAITAADQTVHRPEEAPLAEESRKIRKKRSTELGEARTKIIAALTAWHQYGIGSCGNYAPTGVREFVRKFHYTCSTGQFSAFLKREFGSHAKYRVACHNQRALRERLAILNGEVPARALKIRDDYSPDRLPARPK